MSPIEEVIINKKSNINPIWIMRQAGRYLPEFREIRKENPNFINLCLNDDLSSKITLQPLKRFELDAAIIFSDILMLPYGLGQKVEFEKNFGPKLGELNLNETRSWENQHVAFTHGYGLALAPVSRVKGSGDPDFLIGDLPVAIDPVNPMIFMNYTQIYPQI